MSLEKLTKDSFLLGMLSGLITMTVFYIFLSGIRSIIINYYGNPYMLRPPAVQLFTMLLNIIIFRFLIINFKREQTGKGILFITVLATLAYFFIFFRVNK